MTTVQDQLAIPAGVDHNRVRVSVRLVREEDRPAIGVTVPGGVTTSGVATAIPALDGSWSMDLAPTEDGAMAPTGLRYMLGVSGLPTPLPARYFLVPAGGGPYELETVETGAPGNVGGGGGGGAAPSFYKHVQDVASAQWTVVHGLGYKPGGIFVRDSANTEWKPRVEQVDANTLVLSFFVNGAPAPFTGEAYIS